LSERGFVRFEVLARESDRELIRSLARRLADDTPEAAQIRSVVDRAVRGEPILDLSRPCEEGRKIDL
jgi:hypothetical protein